MKGIDYFKGTYVRLNNRLVRAGDAVRDYHTSLAELASFLHSPISQHPLLDRHDQGLNRVIVDDSLEPVEIDYRAPNSDLTIVLMRAEHQRQLVSVVEQP